MFKHYLYPLLAFTGCGTALASAISSANSTGALSTETLPANLPQCVNSTRYLDWSGAVAPTGCDNALTLMRHRITERRTRILYNFFSKRVYRYMPPVDGQPLVAASESGNCAIVIRMARDFAPDALPTEDGGHYRTINRSPVQLTTWFNVFRAAEPLYYGCLYQPTVQDSGWAAVDDNIIVAFWPRQSPMNQQYGGRVLAQSDMDSSNSTSVSSS